MTERPRLVGDDNRTRLPASDPTPGGEDADHLYKTLVYASNWIGNLAALAFIVLLAVTPGLVVAAWRLGFR
jgi:hypothetical protein